MIDKNTENFPNELTLFPIKGRNIKLSFSGDRISSDGGLLLLREIDRELNLLSSASKCILDSRDERYIDHTVKELLTQRLYIPFENHTKFQLKTIPLLSAVLRSILINERGIKNDKDDYKTEHYLTQLPGWFFRAQNIS